MTRALPASAGTVYSAGIDLGAGDKLAPFEVMLSAPALTVTQLPNAKTQTYSIEQDDNAAFNSPTAIENGVVVQTGANSAGAVAVAFACRVKTACERYIRLKVVGGTDVGDCSAAEATLELLL